MSTVLAPAATPAAKPRFEIRFVLYLSAALLMIILLVSFLVPSTEDDDLAPTTYNNGSSGIKAAFLLLNQLGYRAERWDDSTAALATVAAPHTTLILANPTVPPELADEAKAAIAAFLTRGGRVLVTGVEGAYLIPNAHTASPNQFYKSLCFTTPEGQGPLARAGQLSIDDPTRWADDSAATRVQQRCGSDAVVVTFNVGAGQAIWWASPMPMSNRGLHEDASLKLLLASIGAPGRRILFDESLHGAATSVWDLAKGLPIRSLSLQVATVALLLVLSFGRRNGPIRLPLRTVRSSPLEFAESMGHLYNKAGATQVAVDTARRRLYRFLHDRCGLPLATLNASPEEIAASLQSRLPGDWSAVAEHLTQAESTSDKRLSSKSAVALVKAIDADIARLAAHLNFKT